MTIQANRFRNLAVAISAYSDEEYTLARKLVSTGLVGSDARISGSDEDYTGTIRWYKPLGGTLTYDASADNTDGTQTLINVGVDSATEGRVTGISTQVANYVKTVRTHGASQYNVQQVVSGQDGLAKIARDFAETRARDEDAAMRAILNSVATTEALTGSNGLRDPDSDPGTEGFYVDLNDNTAQLVAGYASGDTSNALVDTTATSAGRKVQPILAAAAMAWRDYEPDFMYLVVTPSVYLDIRASNLIDEQSSIEDGNVRVETILGGKFRLIVSRDGLASRAGAANVQSTSTSTSLLMLPGAISMTPVSVPNPVAFDRDESMGRGTGVTEAWYRWGYIMHPRGYSWEGASQFVQNIDTSARASAGVVTGYYHNVTSNQRTPFARRDDMLNLGILPIFHS